tara:strand:- start:195 stop:497 length:303 start_codon:yes stop_codon:yes gene_type:complete
MSLDREGEDTEQGGPQLRGNIPSSVRSIAKPPDTVSQRKSTMNFGTLRPQILVAIICATVFSIFALWMGYKMEATEIVTAVIGGIFGFLGGVSLKVLENE